MSGDERYRQVYEIALESFKETFPHLDDAHAEKLMNAFIEVKRQEVADA